MIIFVGDKPSDKNIDENVAFVGTKSYKTLLDWIYRMNLSINDVRLINKNMVHVYPTDLCKFVVLGNEAEKVIRKHWSTYWDEPTQQSVTIAAEYFKLPHPSGLNRQLNDEEFINQKLKECEEWIKNIK